jgi:uncharacterized membrane protein YdjX (TVP38/TMEM64 family)
LFWLYPILASVGSILGAAITYYIGRRLGEAGLKWFIQPNQMKRFRARIEDKGAVALAVLDLLPPPFPFTACVLVAGALKVDTWFFFVTLFVTRLLRFGGESVLAYFYGKHIVRWLTSNTFEYIGIGFVLLMFVGSAIATVQVIRKSRRSRRNAGPCARRNGLGLERCKRF